MKWYPGHMAKAKKILRENLKLVDAVIELLDARIPYSSRNPSIKTLTGQKPVITVLNKYDLADPRESVHWTDFLRTHNIVCMPLDSISGEGLPDILNKIETIAVKKAANAKAKGIRNTRIKVMAAGIPNTGKSSFINRVAGKSSAKTGNIPGITRGMQWIRTGRYIDLLDTPGIIKPCSGEETVFFNLAVTGAVSDEAFDLEDIGLKLLLFIRKRYPVHLAKRYNLGESDLSGDGFELLQHIGRKRGYFYSGGKVDITRTASAVLDDFRKGRIGRITLERTDDPHVLSISQE